MISATKETGLDVVPFSEQEEGNLESLISRILKLPRLSSSLKPSSPDLLHLVTLPISVQ